MRDKRAGRAVASRDDQRIYWASALAGLRNRENSAIQNGYAIESFHLLQFFKSNLLEFYQPFKRYASALSRDMRCLPRRRLVDVDNFPYAVDLDDDAALIMRGNFNAIRQSG